MIKHIIIAINAMDCIFSFNEEDLVDEVVEEDADGLFALLGMLRFVELLSIRLRVSLVAIACELVFYLFFLYNLSQHVVSYSVHCVVIDVGFNIDCIPNMFNYIIGGQIILWSE